MNIEIPDELFQRCVEYLQRNSENLGDRNVEQFILSAIEQATWENRCLPSGPDALASQKDALTQCYNRRKFDHDLAVAAGRAQASGQPLYCKFVGVGVTRLREINDREGLQQGNQMLADIAAHLMRFFQPAPVYRTEGDEFVIWMGEQEVRPVSEFQFLYPIRLAVIDLMVVLEGNTLSEIGYRIREKIRASIREGAEQGLMV